MRSVNEILDQSEALADRFEGNPFTEALKVLKRRGWTQAPTFYDSKSETCVGLAIDEVLRDTDFDDYDHFWSFIGNILGRDYDMPSIAYVNDHILQSQKEAENLLEKLAKEWSEK